MYFRVSALRAPSTSHRFQGIGQLPSATSAFASGFVQVPNPEAGPENGDEWSDDQGTHACELAAACFLCENRDKLPTSGVVLLVEGEGFTATYEPEKDEDDE